MTFITFEGIEGSGKTTQVNLALAWLHAHWERVLHTREPGGTAIGNRIRAILLDPIHAEMAAEAEILLYSAARAQIVRQVIRPHLEKGGIVVCDRFYDSTLAYQGYGRGLSLPDLRHITAFATGGLTPDLTLYLDLEVEAGLRRKAQTPEEWNRLEAQPLAFHRRVRAGYLALAAAEPERWRVIDADRPVEVVQEEIRRIVGAALAVGVRRET
jgi:dTMP kinase